LGGVVEQYRISLNKWQLFLERLWTGEQAKLEESVTRLQTLAAPIASQIAWMSLADLLGLFDAQVVNGHHHALPRRLAGRSHTRYHFRPVRGRCCADVTTLHHRFVSFPRRGHAGRC